jgi:hypothetical protein
VFFISGIDKFSAELLQNKYEIQMIDDKPSLQPANHLFSQESSMNHYSADLGWA